MSAGSTPGLNAVALTVCSFRNAVSAFAMGPSGRSLLLQVDPHALAERLDARRRAADALRLVDDLLDRERARLVVLRGLGILARHHDALPADLDAVVRAL